MALKKSIQTKAGNYVEYWKIISCNNNLNDKWVDIYIVPFVSEELRLQGFAPVRDEVINVMVDFRNPDACYGEYFEPAAMSASGENIVQIAYRYIKEKITAFENAVDC